MKHRATKKLFIAVLLMYLAGCSSKELLRRWVPAEEDKLARTFLEDIRLGKTDEARAILDKRLPEKDAEPGLKALAELFNRGEQKSIEVVGANTSTYTTAITTRKTISLTYQ